MPTIASDLMGLPPSQPALPAFDVQDLAAARNVMFPTRRRPVVKEVEGFRIVKAA
jgi:hypothetical protein